MQTGLVVNSDATVATFFEDIAGLCGFSTVDNLVLTLPNGHELAATDQRTLRECGVLPQTAVTATERPELEQLTQLAPVAVALEPEPATSTEDDGVVALEAQVAVAA
jgi:hypothetical protein